MHLATHIQLDNYVLVCTNNNDYHTVSLQHNDEPGAIAIAIAEDYQSAIHKIFGYYKDPEDLKDLNRNEIEEMLAWAILSQK